jgi:pyrophosphatase PpaX
VAGELAYRTILFDLDGTLIDSIRLILDSYHHTFATFSLPPQSDASFLHGIGTPLRAQFAGWAADEPAMEAMIAAYRAYNLEHHDTRVKAYPGVVAAVRALAAAGVRLGGVTSKNRPGTRRGLRVAGLDDVIEVLVCVEDVENPKPHREPVDRAVAQLAADPASTLFVGDSVHDMRAGRAAEVGTGAALWGPFRRADLAPGEPGHWLASPADVVRLVLGEERLLG